MALEGGGEPSESDSKSIFPQHKMPFRFASPRLPRPRAFGSFYEESATKCLIYCRAILPIDFRISSARLLNGYSSSFSFRREREWNEAAALGTWLITVRNPFCQPFCSFPCRRWAACLSSSTGVQALADIKALPWQQISRSLLPRHCLVIKSQRFRFKAEQRSRQVTRLSK